MENKTNRLENTLLEFKIEFVFVSYRNERNYRCEHYWKANVQYARRLFHSFLYETKQVAQRATIAHLRTSKYFQIVLK